MRSKWKWILIILPFLVVLLLILGCYAIPLPYFLSSTMEQYLLDIPEGENAKESILSHCEVISTEMIAGTECWEYSFDEAALHPLLPDGAVMEQVESVNSVVYFRYTIANDVKVLLAYDDLGWNHTIVKYNYSGWMFTSTRNDFNVHTPWVRYVS